MPTPTPAKKGARLSKQTKAVIKGLGKPGEQNRMKSEGRKALRAELRTPGVSKKETRLVKKAARIVKKRTTSGEAAGVRKVFKKQAARSTARAMPTKSSGKSTASKAPKGVLGESMRLIHRGVTYQNGTPAQKKIFLQAAKKRARAAKRAS
jgi:hypothetical protein